MCILRMTAIASVKTSGLIGDKYISLSPAVLGTVEERRRNYGHRIGSGGYWPHQQVCVWEGVIMMRTIRHMVLALCSVFIAAVPFMPRNLRSRFCRLESDQILNIAEGAQL